MRKAEREEGSNLLVRLPATFEAYDGKVDSADGEEVTSGSQFLHGDD